MTNRVNEALLARFLSGECTPAEAALVERWMAVAPENRQAVDSLRAVWEQASAGDSTEFDAGGALWTRIRDGMSRSSKPRLVDDTAATIESPPYRRSKPFHQPFSRTRGVWWWGAAAAVLIATVGVLSVRGSRLASNQQQVAATPMREVSTKRAQRADVYLSDGTHVVLGPASRLRFASTFTDRRDVHLEGEALFEVADDNIRPFAVHTRDFVARDIGTRFAVRAYPETHGVEVVVAEGAVQLQRADSAPAVAASRAGMDAGVLLEANDIGRFAESGALVVERGVDVSSHLAWAFGRLVFKDTPLRQAIADLSRFYDTDIELAESARDSLGNFPITASLEDEALTEVLRLLSATLDARIERLGRGARAPVRIHAK